MAFIMASAFVGVLGAVGKTCTARDTTTPAPRDIKDWPHFQGALRADAAAASGAKVVFYGDSITEAFRGTAWGRKVRQNEGIHGVWQELFEPTRALALAIAGDQTQNLLWRIGEGGELPDTLQPKVIAVAIGTNNVGNGHCNADATLAGVRAVLSALRERRPKAKLLVLGLLPRGPSQCRRDRSLCLGGAPLSPERNMFTAPLQRINAALAKEPGVTFFRGWDVFVEPVGPSSKTSELTQVSDGSNSSSTKQRHSFVIPSVLMPDYLHPSAEGSRRWGLQIKEVLDRLLAEP